MSARGDVRGAAQLGLDFGLDRAVSDVRPAPAVHAHSIGPDAATPVPFVCPCACGVTGRTPQEWLRHSESLRLAAEGSRLLAEGYRRAADAMAAERMARARRDVSRAARAGVLAASKADAEGAGGDR